MDNKWLNTVLDTYELKDFNIFLSKFLLSNVIIINYATTVKRYYNFACLQNNLFLEAVKEDFEVLTNNSIEELNSYKVSWAPFAYGFGIYALIRTSLEACRKLCDSLYKLYPDEALKEYRENHYISIQRIIDIANDIVKHPLVDCPPKTNTKASQPGGLDISGTLTLYQWDWDNGKEKMLTTEINPDDDLKFVHSYLEGLAPILLKLNFKKLLTV